MAEHKPAGVKNQQVDTTTKRKINKGKATSKKQSPVKQVSQATSYNGPVSATSFFKIERPKSIAAVIILAVSNYYQIYWMWGVLFLVWFFLDIKNKRTHLLEEIPLAESPILYCIVLFTWLMFGLWTIINYS